ncbi:MAG TPA: HIT family protein [Rugosibacter sp.]|nr:HIT family protein [Rugosibacter sp.]HQN46198.1 HIT family protein [Rugosibacter sp.]
MSSIDCALCRQDHTGPNGEGDLLWQDSRCRVVRVTGAEGEQFPGFCRVIWHEHVKEMSDLTATDAAHLMQVVLAVERTLRLLLTPDKINLASLGNMVPHVHWHVIPRWQNDSHFPAPIWATANRTNLPRDTPLNAVLQSALNQQLSFRS